MIAASIIFTYPDSLGLVGGPLASASSAIWRPPTVAEGNESSINIFFSSRTSFVPLLGTRVNDVFEALCASHRTVSTHMT